MKKIHLIKIELAAKERKVKQFASYQTQRIAFWYIRNREWVEAIPDLYEAVRTFCL